MIVQVGVYPGPLGGISIYIKRFKQYLDNKKIKNVVWDLGNSKSNANKEIIHIRKRYIPILLLLKKKDIKVIHYHVTGVKDKIFVGFCNILCGKKIKKVISMHGDCENLFNNTFLDILFIKSMSKFDIITCVKFGDSIYLKNKGIKTNIYDIPPFIFPSSNEAESLTDNLNKFIKSKDFIFVANASGIVFFDNEDLYGIDMCIELLKDLKVKYVNKKLGFIFCLPQINNAFYYNTLNERIKEYDLLKEFVFVHEKQELYPIIKRSNIFIRPTNTDGYGVSIAEAIYFNIPAIASDVCERPEGTILFETRNSDDLLNKVKEVMDHYDDYKHKIEDVKLDNNADKILELYNINI